MSWIVAGLLVLLCRLPFSLAMPHYVSEALGAVLSRDGHAASEAVKRFFLAGILNSLLDFGNWYLFVVAQQRSAPPWGPCTLSPPARAPPPLLTPPARSHPQSAH